MFPLAALDATQNKCAGAIALDEAYCGRRRKGKRGRGAAGKSVGVGRDACRGYPSRRRYGTPHTVRHTKTLELTDLKDFFRDVRNQVLDAIKPQ